MEVDWRIPMTPWIADRFMACAGLVELRTAEEQRRKVTESRIFANTDESHQSIVSTTLFFSANRPPATWRHARRHGSRHARWLGAMSSPVIAQKFYSGRTRRRAGRSSRKGGGLGNPNGAMERRPIYAVLGNGPIAAPASRQPGELSPAGRPAAGGADAPIVPESVIAPRVTPNLAASLIWRAEGPEPWSRMARMRERMARI